jgi:hypothetical protein
MADHGADYHRGEMDISQHLSTFNLFTGMTKWGSLYLTALLVLLVLWFCTPAGFLAGLAAAVVLTVLGVLLLRERRPSH